jgi:Holliday junction resolvase
MTLTNKDTQNKNSTAKSNNKDNSNKIIIAKNAQVNTIPVKLQTTKLLIKYIDELNLEIGKNSRYTKGIECEHDVKRCLEKRGWKVKQSAGSRGPADLTAEFIVEKTHNHNELCIQVKSTRQANRIPYISPEETKKLISFAKKRNAEPIIARVICVDEDTIKIEFTHAETKKKINIMKLKDI